MLRFSWFTFAVALVAASAVFAADTLAPSEIQATFFTGQAFTARTLSGTKFKMTFTPDGKMTREPLAQSGNARTGTGTWAMYRERLKRYASLIGDREPIAGEVAPAVAQAVRDHL